MGTPKFWQASASLGSQKNFSLAKIYSVGRGRGKKNFFSAGRGVSQQQQTAGKDVGGAPLTKDAFFPALRRAVGAKKIFSRRVAGYPNNNKTASKGAGRCPLQMRDFLKPFSLLFFYKHSLPLDFRKTNKTKKKTHPPNHQQNQKTTNKTNKTQHPTNPKHPQTNKTPNKPKQQTKKPNKTPPPKPKPKPPPTPKPKPKNPTNQPQTQTKNQNTSNTKHQNQQNKPPKPPKQNHHQNQTQTKTPQTNQHHKTKPQTKPPPKQNTPKPNHKPQKTQQNQHPPTKQKHLQHPTKHTHKHQTPKPPPTQPTPKTHKPKHNNNNNTTNTPTKQTQKQNTQTRSPQRTGARAGAARRQVGAVGNCKNIGRPKTKKEKFSAEPAARRAEFILTLAPVRYNGETRVVFTRELEKQMGKERNNFAKIPTRRAPQKKRKPAELRSVFFAVSAARWVRLSPDDLSANKKSPATSGAFFYVHNLKHNFFLGSFLTFDLDFFL